MGLRYTIEQIIGSYNQLNRIYEILEDIDERINRQPRQLRHIFADKHHDHDKQYLKKNHSHNYDYKYSTLNHTHTEYLEKNETAVNSMQLASHPITDFASVNHAHSYMVLATETSYSVTSTDFSVTVKLQLDTTLERVQILNSSEYPEVTVESVDGNLVTLNCKYSEDDIGQTINLTLLYYTINTNDLLTVVTVNDIYGIQGEEVEINGTVTDENGNPYDEGSVQYTLENN